MRTKLFAAVAVGFLTSHASASLLLYEPFNYTSSDSPQNYPALGTSDTSPNWFKTVSTPPQMTTASLSHPALPAAPASANGGQAVFTTNLASGGFARTSIGGTQAGSVYYSMLVKLNDLTTGGNGVGGSFFAGLQNVAYNDAGTGQNGVGALCIRPAGGVNGATAVNFGIGFRDAVGSVPPFPRVFDSTAYSNTNETFLLVVKYDPGATPATLSARNDLAQLWIFPASGSAVPAIEPTATVFSQNTSASGQDDLLGQTQSIFLRNNASEPSQMILDELRVGTTWADVTATPEPASLGLLGLAGLGLLARRRR